MRARRSRPFILVLLLAAMCANARDEPLSGPDPRFPDDTVSASEPLPPLPFEAALPADEQGDPGGRGQEAAERQGVLEAPSPERDHREPDRVPCWLGASPEWRLGDK